MATPSRLRTHIRTIVRYNAFFYFSAYGHRSALQRTLIFQPLHNWRLDLCTCLDRCALVFWLAAGAGYASILSVSYPFLSAKLPSGAWQSSRRSAFSPLLEVLPSLSLALVLLEGVRVARSINIVFVLPFSLIFNVRCWTISCDMVYLPFEATYCVSVYVSFPSSTNSPGLGARWKIQTRLFRLLVFRVRVCRSSTCSSFSPWSVGCQRFTS